jgi:hypothetical protein
MLIMSAIIFNKTYHRTIKNFAFDDLSQETLIKHYKDGRHFAPLMEQILALDFNLTHVEGCKDHDLVDSSNPEIRFDEKTFTKGGCRFMPSNMIGQGRTFDEAVFHEKAKKLNYVICSNVNFPEITIRFVKGLDLIALYPKGEIKDHNKFFAL